MSRSASCGYPCYNLIEKSNLILPIVSYFLTNAYGLLWKPYIFSLYNNILLCYSGYSSGEVGNNPTPNPLPLEGEGAIMYLM